MAGITIGALRGDDGLINRAIEARDLVDKEAFADAVQTQALLTVAETGRFDTERFEERVKDHLKEYNPNVTEDDEKVTVSDGNYDVTLDKESGDVNGSERTEGIWPRVETHVYEMDGSDYDPKENSEKLTLTVDVTNEDELENVEVVVKDEKGNTIPQTDKIEGTEGQYSYTVEGPSGTYTVEVTGTDKEGNKKTTRKTVTLKENPRIDIDIVFDPDGGPGYVMPSNGESATIKTKMTSSEGNQEPYKYYYAWSEDNTVRPGLKEGESWTETTSGAIIAKDDCVAGKKYYLWIQVYDTRGTLTSQYVVSEPFEVHNNTEDDYKIFNRR